jgi:hypothetical protein
VAASVRSAMTLHTAYASRLENVQLTWAGHHMYSSNTSCSSLDCTLFSTSIPDSLTCTQTELPTSHVSGPVLLFAMFAFFFRGVDRGCESTLTFETVGPRERKDAAFVRGRRLGGSGVVSLVIGVDDGGRSFVSTMGVVGTLDKGDGDSAESELSVSSLRRDDTEALRLREEAATAGALALPFADADSDGVDAGKGLGLGLGFALDFGLSMGFRSGEVEVPLRGDERCFPVAL